MAYEHISDEDWQPMRSLAFEMAQLISDQMESADPEETFEEKELRVTFEAQLEFLEKKYGPHPWLIDIRADACEEPNERVRLRIAGIELVDDSEADLKGQFCVDLVRDYFYELNNRESAAIWLRKAKALSHRITDPELLSEIAEIESEVNDPK